MRGPGFVGIPIALCALIAATLALGGAGELAARSRPAGPTPAAPAACPPLPAGIDTFPSALTLVINNSGVGEPFVMRLSGADHPDAEVERDAQSGDTIAIELTWLELSGFQPRVGAVTVRGSTTRPSLGLIRDVALAPSCELAGGHAFLDLFVEIELPELGETWIHQDPIRIEGAWDALPPRDARFESPTITPVDLIDRESAIGRGQIFYALHHADPPFPPAGADCFDTLFTADLYLTAPDATAHLVGFGPGRLLRGPTLPGGLCHLGGTPCDDDADCPFLDTCAHDRIETEIVALDLIGFDSLLGSWQLAVRPGTGTSDCCESHPAPGCSDPVCEAWVCGQDDYCCSAGWDFFCASLAASEPLCADGCFDPDAAPSLGTVQSVHLDRTYPAGSELDLFVRLDCADQGSLQNQEAVPLAPAAPLTNLPHDPGTEYRYPGSGISVFDESDLLAGELSNVALTLQAPKDCQPPPPAGEACRTVGLDLRLTLAPCPAEPLRLEGPLRVLRDHPVDDVGLGQEVIDTILAHAELTGAGACNGPVTARLRPVAISAGETSSLTPEEFFPADSFFDVAFGIEAGVGPLTADLVRLATSVNALPPDAGEIYFGPQAVIGLRDASEIEVGEIGQIRLEFLESSSCPAGSRATIRATGPTHADFDVGIPEGGGGVAYDVVRGDLGADGGSFASAACLVADAGSTLSDPDTPPVGDGYYYVARDGFGAFDGSWNGPGTSQEGDRDLELPSCP